MSSPSTVLVTGATGMIGRALVARLREQEVRVITAGRRDADIAWELGAPLGMLREKVDAVVHLAAQVHVRGAGYADEEAFIRANTQASVQLATECVEQGVGRFVFMSSIGVLGGKASQPLRETDTPNPHTAYARSKLQAEQQLRCFSKSSGMPVVILRAPAVIGEGLRGNPLTLVNAVRRGLPLPVNGIRNRRSFVALGNLIDAIELSLRSTVAPGNTFHVANDECWSTPEFCRQAAEALGCKARLFSFPPSLLRRGFQWAGRPSLADGLLEDLLVDTTFLRASLGWEPRQALRDALKQAIVST